MTFINVGKSSANDYWCQGRAPVVVSMTPARAGADTKRCRHCSTAMYCRASGVSGGGALADGPTGEGSNPRRLVIQTPASSARVPADTPAVGVQTFLILVNKLQTKPLDEVVVNPVFLPMHATPC